jgi:serine/threonine protein kinase/WD40 repeat protein
MPDDSLLLGQLAEDFSHRVRTGELPSIEEYAAKYPALADRIRALFPTLLLLEGMARGQPPGDAATTFGPDSRSDSLEPGQMFGHYRLERKLGQGGMGVVYEAVHVPLEKRVALKVLSIAAGESAEQLERFLREARTAAELHHTNIVPVFDIGTANGLVYYAMQLIVGRSLEGIVELLQKDRPADGAALVAAGRARSADYFRQVAELGAQAADALAYAHQRGITHRDIKPANLLLDEQGVLWITDFGLARRVADPSLTVTGAVLGTPRYMSPEQAEAARKPIDHRTDIYSLGATLYELVTRQPPFNGKTPVDVLLQVIEREPMAPRRLEPAVPRDLDTIIVKAMAKRAEDRYQMAAEMAEDLRRFLAKEPIKARRIGPVGRLARWSRRNPVVASLLITVALTLVAGTAGSMWFAFEAAEQAQDAIDKRNRAWTSEEIAKDQLCRSLFEQARNLRNSGQLGRRWDMLDRLKRANELRVRKRLSNEPPEAGVLPTLADLRHVAMEAIMLTDARSQFSRSLISDTWIEDISPDGKYLLLAQGKQWDRPIDNLAVEDWASGRRTLKHSFVEVVRSGNVHPNGTSLCAFHQGRGFCVLDLQTGALTPLTSPGIPSKAYVVNPLFSPNGRFLAALHIEEGGKGTYCVVWDWKASPQKIVCRVPCPYSTGAGSLRLEDRKEFVAFSPDSRFMAFAAEKTKLGIVDLANPKSIKYYPLPAEVNGPLAWNPREPLLVISAKAADSDNNVLLWDVELARCRAQFTTFPPWQVEGIACHPKLAVVAIGLGFSVSCHSTHDGKQLLDIPPRQSKMRWLADGRLAFARRESFNVWEFSHTPSAVSSRQFPILESNSNWEMNRATLSDNGELLISVTEQPKPKVVLTDVSKGQILWQKDLLTSAKKTDFLFHYGSECQQIVAWDKTDCAIWDLRTGKEVQRRPSARPGPRRHVAFTADGKVLVVHQQKETVTVRSVFEDREIFSLAGKGKTPQAEETDLDVQISSNGQFLAVTKRTGSWTSP